MNIIQTDHQYVAGTYKRFPVALVRGKGAIAFDDEGRRYIDLGSGIAVNCLGYGDEQWKNAVKAQHVTWDCAKPTDSMSCSLTVTICI